MKLSVPVRYKRDALVPLDNGPWLVVAPSASGVLPVMVLCWLVIFLALWRVPNPSVVVRGLWFVVLVVGGFGLLVAHLTRQELQVCPACLHANTRGATRCHRCHFEG